MRIFRSFQPTRFALIATLILTCAPLLLPDDAAATSAEEAVGVHRVYAVPPDQAERVSSRDRIKSAAASGSMMAIWETLEHGERVECLDCIPIVGDLLYDHNPRTREIAAWWLRRRVAGVFGPGQIYEQTLQALQTSPDPIQRAYAANALGEFLALPGIDACAFAVEKDPDPSVRAAAAAALGRLNDDGRGALSKALADVDPRVKLAALRSAGRINTFGDVPAVANLVSDSNATVRRNAAQLLGQLRSPDGVEAALAFARDPDANVRNAACHTLGALHDPRARPVLDELAQNDPDTFVRDQAKIALRRL